MIILEERNFVPRYTIHLFHQFSLLCAKEFHKRTSIVIIIIVTYLFIYLFIYSLMLIYTRLSWINK